MNEHDDWADLRDRRLAEPGATQAYETARVAHEQGRTAREAQDPRPGSGQA